MKKTRLIKMKPIDAIKETSVRQPVKNYEEIPIDVGTKVRDIFMNLVN